MIRTFFRLERDLALDAQDAGALEAGGDAAVEVLLARDVELADDVGLEQQRHLHGDLQGLAVEQEGRRVVDLVGAGGLVLDAVDHDLAGLELHQRRAVVFAELGKGRPHVADDLGVVIGVVVVAAGRAVAEKLFVGLQLLVHFQAALESQPGVGRGLGFPARGVADLLLRSFRNSVAARRVFSLFFLGEAGVTICPIRLFVKVRREPVARRMREIVPGLPSNSTLGGNMKKRNVLLLILAVLFSIGLQGKLLPAPAGSSPAGNRSGPHPAGDPAGHLGQHGRPDRPGQVAAVEDRQRTGHGQEERPGAAAAGGPV